jgi:hypothetical protein
MAPARPRRAPVSFHADPPLAAPEIHFPAAVAGEQYERYAKAVWTKAQQWLAMHWARASERASTAIDVRQTLRSVAANDINRHLHPQEEQLLSEIVHARWAAHDASSSSAVDASDRSCDEDSEPR